jgi:NitT/TauT family transport system ATP-binding protein
MVSKRFNTADGFVEALADVTFTASEGSFTTIVGPSGCGKTTLLRIVAGLIPMSEGSVRIDGIEVDGPATGLGIVFQKPVLLEWRTVLANVLLPIEILGGDRQLARVRAMNLLETAGLHGFESRYPRELSGGMQQRAAICRALISDPDVLLMDEPFAALDALTREEMGMELLRIWESTNKTILFVTHSIDEAILLSDQVIVMTSRPGRVLESVSVPLSRPRSPKSRSDARFAETRAGIEEHIYSARSGSRGPGLEL